MDKVQARSETMNIERQALLLSLLGSCVLAALGLASAVLIGAQSILLEGLFNSVYSVVALFTLYVAGLLRKPASDDFPFGYDAFTPLVNLIKSLLVAGVSLGALWGAVTGLAHGGSGVPYGPAALYGAIATAIAVSVTLRLAHLARTSGSELVGGDISSWTTNSILSGGVFVSFCFALGLNSLGYDQFAKLVDPVLVVLIVAATIWVPYSLGKSALSQLLAQAPSFREREPLLKLVNASLKMFGYHQFRVIVFRTGSHWDIFADIKVDDESSNVDVRDADLLTDKLRKEVRKVHPNVEVSLFFTTREV